MTTNPLAPVAVPDNVPPQKPGKGSHWPERLGWTTLALLLLLGLPLFICMPLGFDVTLHDLCARNLLQGGIHYRDTFETNLPGMDWLHAAVRTCLGWRSETLRVVDFLIIAGVIGFAL